MVGNVRKLLTSLPPATQKMRIKMQRTLAQSSLTMGHYHLFLAQNLRAVRQEGMNPNLFLELTVPC
jgi:hypothetical protein